jgi:hypothetical protein
MVHINQKSWACFTQIRNRVGEPLKSGNVGGEPHKSGIVWVSHMNQNCVAVSIRIRGEPHKSERVSEFTTQIVRVVSHNPRNLCG